MPVPFALTLEFPGYVPRRRIAELPDLGLQLLGVLDSELPRELTAARYAQRLVDRAELAGRSVDLVVAYCASAPIGYQLALTLRQARPPIVVLLDAMPHLADFVVDTYRAMLVRYGGSPEQAPIDPVELTEHPDRALAAMLGQLRALAGARLIAEVGDDESVVATADALVDSAASWLAHLVAGHNSAFPPWPGTVVLVNSQDASFEGPWPGAAATQVVRVACGHDELVEHPGLRSALAAASRASR